MSKVILDGSNFARGAMATGTALGSPARVKLLILVIMPSLIRAAASLGAQILWRCRSHRILLSTTCLPPGSRRSAASCSPDLARAHHCRMAVF